MDNLKKMIREVPDFPKPGINFYDITTLLKSPEGLRQTVDALAAEYEGMKIDTVIGVEARGFIFAPALAYHLGAGLCRCANRRSCRQRRLQSRTILNMARTRYRFIAMRLGQDIE